MTCRRVPSARYGSVHAEPLLDVQQSGQLGALRCRFVDRDVAGDADAVPRGDLEPRGLAVLRERGGGVGTGIDADLVAVEGVSTFVGRELHPPRSALSGRYISTPWHMTTSYAVGPVTSARPPTTGQVRGELAVTISWRTTLRRLPSRSSQGPARRPTRCLPSHRTYPTKCDSAWVGSGS